MPDGGVHHSDFYTNRKYCPQCNDYVPTLLGPEPGLALHQRNRE